MDFRLLLGLSVLSHLGDRQSGGGGGKSRSPKERRQWVFW